MTDGLVERSSRSAVRWTDGRLVVALQILAFLPAKPGVTIEEIIDHVEQARRSVYRILGAIERSGIRIETKIKARNRKLFFLPPLSQRMIDKLFRLG